MASACSITTSPGFCVQITQITCFLLDTKETLRALAGLQPGGLCVSIELVDPWSQRGGGGGGGRANTAGE